MLAIKPHSYQVRFASESGDTGVVYAEDLQVYSGLLIPQQPASVFVSWGLELKNPYLLYAELSDVSALKPADRILSGGSQFAVYGIERRDVGNLAAHARVILERLDYV